MADECFGALSELEWSIHNMQHEHDIELEKSKHKIKILSRKLRDCLEREKTSIPASTRSEGIQNDGTAGQTKYFTNIPAETEKDGICVENSHIWDHPSIDGEVESDIDETLDTIREVVRRIGKSLPSAEVDMKSLTTALKADYRCIMDSPRWEAFMESETHHGLGPEFVAPVSQLKILNRMFGRAGTLSFEEMFELIDFLFVFAQYLQVNGAKVSEEEGE